MVLIHRWSLYTLRLNNMESISLGNCKMWSLQAGGLHIQVAFRAGVTVFLFGCSAGNEQTNENFREVTARHHTELL